MTTWFKLQCLLPWVIVGIGATIVKTDEECSGSGILLVRGSEDLIVVST